MIINISPAWILSDEHPACSYGQPVLVHKTDGDPFGPGDIVQCYPGWPFQPAREAVARMARTKPGLSRAKRALVEKFITCGAEVVSLLPIDAGFDAIDAGIPVILPAGVGAVRVPDGTARGRLITGTRDEIVRQLRTLGYRVPEGGAA